MSGCLRCGIIAARGGMDFVEQLKSSVDIVSVVGEYVKLRRSGANRYMGLCPFHSEKTPSFTVHVVYQFYKCFSCGVHGADLCQPKPRHHAGVDQCGQRHASARSSSCERASRLSAEAILRARWLVALRSASLTVSLIVLVPSSARAETSISSSMSTKCFVTTTVYTGGQ